MTKKISQSYEYLRIKKYIKNQLSSIIEEQLDKEDLLNKSICNSYQLQNPFINLSFNKAEEKIEKINNKVVNNFEGELKNNKKEEKKILIKKRKKKKLIPKVQKKIIPKMKKIVLLRKEEERKENQMKTSKNR